MFKIFDKLGGEVPTLDVIQRRRGFRPSHRAVVEWQIKKKIPAINIYHLTEECRERDIPVSPDDFQLPKDLPRKGVKASRAPASAGRVSPPT